MERIIGITGDPQQTAWIENWASENADIELVEIFNGFLADPGHMMSFLADHELLERNVDGFVFDTFRYSDATVHAILEGLQTRGFKMYSARGETSRPIWKR